MVLLVTDPVIPSKILSQSRNSRISLYVIPIAKRQTHLYMNIADPLFFLDDSESLSSNKPGQIPSKIAHSDLKLAFSNFHFNTWLIKEKTSRL